MPGIAPGHYGAMAMPLNTTPSAPPAGALPLADGIAPSACGGARQGDGATAAEATVAGKILWHLDRFVGSPIIWAPFTLIATISLYLPSGP